jgi:hypothetical protein
MKQSCPEGKMTCGGVLQKGLTPGEIIKMDFPLLGD